MTQEKKAVVFYFIFVFYTYHCYGTSRALRAFEKKRVKKELKKNETMNDEGDNGGSKKNDGR